MTGQNSSVLTGVETLLEQTRRRVSQVVAERHALLILTKTHERFYKDQLRGVPARNLLVQPFNRGTAPAIAYSLTHLNSVDRDSKTADERGGPLEHLHHGRTCECVPQLDSPQSS